MARRLTTITDEQYRQQRDFDKWMKTQARVVQLVCLINGHEFPDPFSDKLTHRLLPAGEHGRRRSTIQLEAPCQRTVGTKDDPDAGETCGTVIRKLLGPGGIISGTKPIYDYEQWYRVPAGLLEHGWLSKAQRGIIRQYLYVELPELRRAEAASRERKRARAARREQPA